MLILWINVYFKYASPKEASHRQIPVGTAVRNYFHITVHLITRKTRRWCLVWKRHLWFTDTSLSCVITTWGPERPLQTQAQGISLTSIFSKSGRNRLPKRMSVLWRTRSEHAHPWQHSQPHRMVLKPYERQGNNPKLSICPGNEKSQAPDAKKLRGLGPHSGHSLSATVSPSHSHLNPTPQDSKEKGHTRPSFASIVSHTPLGNLSSSLDIIEYLWVPVITERLNKIKRASGHT